jgi:triphosphoribosyl-dephospho-CoA synthase
LLLAPLAAVPRAIGLADGIEDVLSRLNAVDTRHVYAAIREAHAGGLGQVPRWDITGPSPPSLLAAMCEAAERDMVARQYANGFKELFEVVIPWILEGRYGGRPLIDTILHVHVRLLARFPDSLIARKCGSQVAESASRRAEAVLEAGDPDDTAYLRALSDLDFWLRSDHHRRNPGTTADLIAAGLFALLREGLVAPPFR